MPYSLLTELRGLVQFQKRALLTQALMPFEIDAIVRGRTLGARARLAAATPVGSVARGSTNPGAARAGWQSERRRLGEWVIFNRVARRGYVYPGALISGTGSRGQGGVPGFTGVFSRSWLGMYPNRNLRTVWIDEARRPFVVPRLFQ